MLAVQRVCDHSFISDRLGENHIVVDLGMNRGQFTRWIVENTPARVFGVEPAPDLFAALPRHERVEARPLAVGGRPGSLELNVYAGHCASVVPGLAPEIAERSVMVEMIDLDGLLRSFSVEKVDLLKVDIEGAELDMFAALSAETLKKIDQITIEFHDFLRPEQRAQVETAIAKLRANGFFVMNFGNRVYTDVLALDRASWSLGIFDVATLYAVKYRRGIARMLSKALGRPWS